MCLIKEMLSFFEDAKIGIRAELRMEVRRFNVPLSVLPSSAPLEFRFGGLLVLYLNLLRSKCPPNDQFFLALLPSFFSKNKVQKQSFPSPKG